MKCLHDRSEFRCFCDFSCCVFFDGLDVQEKKGVINLLLGFEFDIHDRTDGRRLMMGLL